MPLCRKRLLRTRLPAAMLQVTYTVVTANRRGDGVGCAHNLLTGPVAFLPPPTSHGNIARSPPRNAHATGDGLGAAGTARTANFFPTMCADEFTRW